MKHHECTCIQCCNARTVVKPKPSAEESAMLAWMPSRYDPPDANVAPFFGLDRSAPSSFFSRPLPRERWWTRARWKLGRWLSRGDPSA